VPLDEKAAFALTRKGTGELKSAQTELSALELKLLVLMDGGADFGRILKAFSAQPQVELVETVNRMKRTGLIVDRDKSDAGGEHGGIEATGFFTRPIFPAPDAAGAESADQTLELLKRNGYVARIAKRAAEERTLKKGDQLQALVIEDDPQLAKLLRMFLLMHELVPRLAANKDEIVAALRIAPKPDVVLLDVVLPDIDGFEVLSRLKQHDVLRTIPVIMMTAKATREAVLQGLARGADGYITKPFDVDIIWQAVRSVLGLK
jgi:two-component system OmpR family response regulator